MGEPGPKGETGCPCEPGCPADANPSRPHEEEEVAFVKRRNKVQEDWFWRWFWRDLAGPLVLLAVAFTCLWLCLEYNPNYLLVVFCACFGLTPCLPVLFWPMLASLFMLVLHGWVVTTGDFFVGWRGKSDGAQTM